MVGYGEVEDVRMGEEEYRNFTSEITTKDKTRSDAVITNYTNIETLGTDKKSHRMKRMKQTIREIRCSKKNTSNSSIHSMITEVRLRQHKTMMICQDLRKTRSPV